MSRSRFWLGTMLALGLTLRLWLAWLPIGQLVIRALPDDAFIYFVIARHMGAGLGATFDGLKPTNGFHPGWALLLTPIFGRWPSGDLPIHLALTLSALFDTLTGLAIFVIVRRVGHDARAALVSSALYMFNGKMIYESVNGLETALAGLLLAACFLILLRACLEPGNYHWAVLLGLTCGLMTLARTDLGVMYFVFISAFAMSAWRHVQARQAIVVIGVALVGFGVIVAPWVIWSQWQVGTAVQSSAVAVPRLFYADIRQGLTSAVAFAVLWRTFLGPILNLAVRTVLIHPGVAWLAILLGLMARLFVRRDGTQDRVSLQGIRAYMALSLPLVGGLVIALIHIFVRWFPRGWYFVPLAFGASLIAGPALVEGLDALRDSRFAKMAARARWPESLFAAAGALLALVACLHAIKLWREPEYLWQADMLAGAVWLAHNTPPGTIVGSFNPGIYAYFSARPVINLDGLVDWEAIRARQRRALLDYLTARGGQYLIDNETFVLVTFRTYLGEEARQSLKRVESLPIGRDRRFGPVQVYRIGNP